MNNDQIIENIKFFEPILQPRHCAISDTCERKPRCGNMEMYAQLSKLVIFALK